MPFQSETFTIVGAGLVGSLLATLLAQRGHAVEVFEKRRDPRRAGFAGGRSINLALSERGIHALRAAGMARPVLAQAVRMRGRMVHPLDGAANLQPYGVSNAEVNWSVSRSSLNIQLLDAAETAGASVTFEQALVDADFDAGSITLEAADGKRRQYRADIVLGTDGAGSAVRAAMNRVQPLREIIKSLDHGYKELEIPAASHGTEADFRALFVMEPEALHIWPRGRHMCIALPNRGGSFTVTLFLPATGDAASFAALANAREARAFFKREFPDLLALMPHFDVDYASHPVGSLATLYLYRWHLDGRALLLGDAAHAFVPFHGQGMNAGFEDAAELATLLADEPLDTAAAFAQFERQRKPNTDAIAAMALENYIEMRDSVADPDYLRKRALATALAERAPAWLMPRYRMVTFTHLPYAFCLERGRAQDALLQQLLASGGDTDIDAAVASLKRALPPLPPLRHD